MRIRSHHKRYLAMSASTLALIGLCSLPAPVMAQQSGSQSMGQLQAGYGGSRYTTAQAASGSTRDANGNRLIVNGIIQAGASQYSQSSSGVSSSSQSQSGSASGSTAIGGATAIGNNLNVVVQGNNNTVIVNSTQTNTGQISAGTVLNGKLVFP